MARAGNYKRAAIALLVAAGCCAAVTVAGAAPLTVGQLVPPDETCELNGVANSTVIQTDVKEGSPYRVPAAGTITSWSFQFGAATVPGIELKVIREVAGGQFEVIGDSPSGVEEANRAGTYPASIPVLPGDEIGVYFGGVGGDCLHGGFAQDTIAYVSGNKAVGSRTTYTPAIGFKVPVSVSVQQPPAIASLSPASGPPAGDTKVIVAGSDFSGATAVSFGNAPAAFVVDSDNQITAFSPSGTGTVDVRVTTPAGQTPATAADLFAYVAPAAVTLAPPGPRTGKRRAALKKCKKRHGKAKAKCQKRAKKLPL